MNRNSFFSNVGRKVSEIEQNTVQTKWKDKVRNRGICL